MLDTYIYIYIYIVFKLNIVKKKNCQFKVKKK
jgi:hypothetical protein